MTFPPIGLTHGCNLSLLEHGPRTPDRSTSPFAPPSKGSTLVKAAFFDGPFLLSGGVSVLKDFLLAGDAQRSLLFLRFRCAGPYPRDSESCSWHLAAQDEPWWPPHAVVHNGRG